jgi:ribonuclease VapC
VIVVETSALIALLFAEPIAPKIAAEILSRTGAVVPASVYVEASFVYGGRNGAAGVQRLDALIAELGLEIVPFSPEHARAAAAAFLRFGKGRHPAGLNFGDCMSYAVAKVKGLPLLYVGTDFGATDVVGVLGFSSENGTGR